MPPASAARLYGPRPQVLGKNLHLALDAPVPELRVGDPLVLRLTARNLGKRSLLLPRADRSGAPARLFLEGILTQEDPAGNRFAVTWSEERLLPRGFGLPPGRNRSCALTLTLPRERMQGWRNTLRIGGRFFAPRTQEGPWQAFAQGALSPATATFYLSDLRFCRRRPLQAAARALVTDDPALLATAHHFLPPSRRSAFRRLLARGRRLPWGGPDTLLGQAILRFVVPFSPAQPLQ